MQSMIVEGLMQPPFAATLMGCLKGASDHFGGGLSAPMLYGLTGHAFLINISENLCPSSPYVWKKDRFMELLPGLGIRKSAEYQAVRRTPAADLLAAEEKLKTHLERGEILMLDYLEHQLVMGCDDKGFVMIKPWSMSPAEVASLTFGTWSECLEKEGWAGFTVLSRAERKTDIRAAARDALQYALELLTTDRHQEKGYRTGFGAYDNWAACLSKGMDQSQGNWWNSMVWAECRSFASRFFKELAPQAGSGADGCEALSSICASIAEDLRKVGQKDLGAAEKLAHLEAARRNEQEAEAGIRSLLESGLR